MDFLHNNAGITTDDLWLDTTSDDTWDRVMSINVMGPWLLLREALGPMRTGGGGAVVNTTSVGAASVVPGRGAYCVSKAALAMLTRVAAYENGSHNVRVNAIAPGTVDTPMTATLPHGASTSSGPPPTGRRGRPSEVAAAAVWLCSDEASYVNGATITVDGGWTTAIAARAAAAAS
ncbi:hypothetical protein GCM10009836_36970 [Pseudonocardia ailaonensis]|uniref:SDR family oxidoreductase n=1 Tax=Pseudonocardia ailaonensis TaxID=367279 RepID=A0ABN2N6C2_9PSEU